MSPVLCELPMKIHVNRVPFEGLHETARYESQALDVDRPDIHASQPFTVSAFISKVEHELVVEADIRGQVDVACGRCLSAFVVPLQTTATLTYHVGPTDVVGSMVVFEDGLPKRSDYRKFEIKGVMGQDDFASMDEMLRRRFARLLQERDDPTRTRRRFSYPPSLVVVDGGKGQLGVCSKVLADLGLDLPHIGLAKRLEEVYFPGRPDPLLIARGSEALFVLQHIRDEAHRFAITYHREKRAKRALVSPLDEVPGVGPARKKALLKRFGSLARLRDATADEIAATPRIGAELAHAIHERLHGALDARDRVSACCRAPCIPCPIQTPTRRRRRRRSR